MPRERKTEIESLSSVRCDRIGSVRGDRRLGQRTCSLSLFDTRLRNSTRVECNDEVSVAVVVVSVVIVLLLLSLLSFCFVFCHAWRCCCTPAPCLPPPTGDAYALYGPVLQWPSC